MKFWDQYHSWEEAETQWTKGAEAAAKKSPLKTLKVLPQMPGITSETARRLKWKSLKYMVLHDKGAKILRHILKHPLRYSFRYIRSILKKVSYLRDGDFFLYGFSSLEAFEKSVKKKSTLFVMGFSYCQKPHECPAKRFTDQCVRDPDHPICRQCDIGKVLHAAPNKTIPLIIPTVHYIGNKIFELKAANPHQEVIFLITACELTLEMFGDWGNMAGIRGIGVRLDGRICNTMKAFELSEEGIKPGLTVVTSTTQSRILDLLKKIR
jgi:hypothetical protein